MRTSALRCARSSSRSFLFAQNLLDQFDLPEFEEEPREQCGILVASGGEIIRVEVVKNYADFPDDDFAIAKSDVDFVNLTLGENEQVVGFIHTHLVYHDATPSDADLHGASKSPNLIHLIYKPATGDLFQFGPDWAERVT